MRDHLEIQNMESIAKTWKQGRHKKLDLAIPLFRGIANRAFPEVLKMKQEEWLKPIIEVDGTSFLVDIARREFREWENPEHSINMHSQEGKELLSQMTGRDWDSFGIDRQLASN